MQTYKEAEQLSMFGQDLWHGRTCPAPSARERQRARTSGSFWRRSSALNAIPFQSLDLTPGAGNLLGEFYWELISPWRGGASTLNTGVSPKDAKESSLSQILQADPPLKYYLSPKACLGILRRAFERGKELPKKLERALKIQAGLMRPDGQPTGLEAYHIEVVGNYSGSSSTGDLNLEKIAELKPDLIIMNIRHEKVYEQLAAIAPTVMIDDDTSYVNWRGRFKQLGQWFDKEAAVEKWLADYDAKAAELAARIRDMIGDETFAVLEANSVHFGSYYIYRSGGPGELVYDELKLTPSAGVPENVWGEVVDAEYFSLIDADHIFFFSDDGRAGDTGTLAVWKNMKAVKAGNVYFGINEDQYNMAFTAMGKELYLEKLANAILNHGNIE